MIEEYAEITHGINIFSEQMAKRMMNKADSGFSGWQNPQNFNVKERLLIKAAKIATTKKVSDKDLVDIANFAMMLFMERWKETFPYKDKQNT